MGYVEDNLIPGERVLYTSRLHWIILVWPCALTLILALAGLSVLVSATAALASRNDPTHDMVGVGVVMIAAAVALASVAILRRHLTEIAVTNKRILMKTGLVSRRTVELLLSKVESVTVREPVVGRVLGYGDVVVRGTGGTPEPFAWIERPLEFRRRVQEQIERRDQASHPT